MMRESVCVSSEEGAMTPRESVCWLAGKKHLLEAEMEELRRAREMGQKQQELFNSLFSIDEQLDSAAHESAKRIAQLQQKMVLLQKKIQEIETPRDDSFDNMYAPLNEPGHRHLSGVVVR